MTSIKGRAWKYGDDVNTDVLFPGKYTYTISDPAEMPPHALEDLDPRFAGEVQPGDIVVGGKNFGCGSSREQAVACPHSVDRVAPVSQVAGTRVHQAFLGTCTIARLEDLAAAAAVLQGRRTAAGTRMIIIPVSSQVYLDALKADYIQTFVAAGAVVESPGCGPCMGNHMGVPAVGEVVISSANRNFQGRMGTKDAEIYLASPAVVAASAIKGAIAHPKEL